jgi:hypothetical protein
MRGTLHGTIILLAVFGSTLIASAFAQDAPARRIADVACTGAPAACVVVATSPSNIAGLWQQAQEGHGFVRYNADGTFWQARTIEDSGAPVEGMSRGTVRFDGDVMTIELAASPVPACLTARYVVGVLHYGAEPVALVYMPVEDECEARRLNFSVPLVRVGDALAAQGSGPLLAVVAGNVHGFSR